VIKAADAPGASAARPGDSAVGDGRAPGAANAAARSGATTYRVERPPKAGPVAVAAKVVLALVFAVTTALCAYRAAVPDATPHQHVPAIIVTGGFAATSLVAVVLLAAVIAWVMRGAHFADNLAFAVLWPIATVLMVIAAGVSLVPQHYLRPGLLLAPAGLAAATMMIAVAWVYNRAATR
jgi:hypothetical protein